MKRFIKTVSLILVMAICLAVPVSAQAPTPYASNYFLSYSAYIVNQSSTSFQVWFEVSAVRGMKELGADYITVEESSDGINWTPVATYDRSDYSNLIARNTGVHATYVTYSKAKSNCQYRAYIELYAKDSSGTAYYGVYGD